MEIFLRKLRSYFHPFSILNLFMTGARRQTSFPIIWFLWNRYIFSHIVRCKWFFFFPRRLPTGKVDPAIEWLFLIMHLQRKFWVSFKIWRLDSSIFPHPVSTTGQTANVQLKWFIFKKSKHMKFYKYFYPKQYLIWFLKI